MHRKKFEKIVAEAVAQIPSHFKKELKNIVFMVEEGSPEGALLGVFEGISLGEQGSGPWELPGQVVIFQRPTEEEAKISGLSVEQIVRETVWHEVAHYFGMEEEKVNRIETQRNAGSSKPRRTNGR